MQETKPVVVTTIHKGVFFGYIETEDLDKKIVTLNNVRMCIYWSSEIRGVVGLAATGPSNTCRVTPAAPHITLTDVTSVMECAEPATKNWEKAPWNS